MELHGYTSPADYKEFAHLISTDSKKSRKTDWLQRLAILIFFGVLCLVLYTVADTRPLRLLMHISGLCFIVMLIFTGLRLKSDWQYARIGAQKQKQGSTLTIDGKGIAVRVDDGGQQSFYPWEEIARVIVSNNLYVFETVSNVAVFFNRKWFKGNQESQLQDMLAKFAKKKPVTYR